MNRMLGIKYVNDEHDCNIVSMNFLNIHDANDMQSHKLGDASIAMSTTCCNDHDWGDSSYDLGNLFKPHNEYEIDNNVCNNIESGFGRVSTLGSKDPTIFEDVESYCDEYESGFGSINFI